MHRASSRASAWRALVVTAAVVAGRVSFGSEVRIVLVKPKPSMGLTVVADKPNQAGAYDVNSNRAAPVEELIVAKLQEALPSSAEMTSQTVASGKEAKKLTKQDFAKGQTVYLITVLYRYKLKASSLPFRTTGGGGGVKDFYKHHCDLQLELAVYQSSAKTGKMRSKALFKAKAAGRHAAGVEGSVTSYDISAERAIKDSLDMAFAGLGKNRRWLKVLERIEKEG